MPDTLSRPVYWRNWVPRHSLATTPAVRRGAKLVIDLQACLTDLAQQRPLFQSEADFQHALAWQLHAMEPAARVRLGRG